MNTLFQRIHQSLAQPRVLTGLTVTAYVTLMVLMVMLWPRLIPFLLVQYMPFMYWVVYLAPAVLLTFGAVGGAIESWRGGKKRERVALAASITGLWGGILFEAMPLIDFGFAGILLIGLGIIVTVAVMARMNWLLGL